jgi:diguanylate cyclase (GGDEF)-like protein/PAS domain S-box-containing protein
MDETTRRDRLARRLIIAIVLVSIVVTLATSSVQLFVEYRRDLEAVQSRFGEIERSHLASVTQNLWLSDRERLQLSLDGIRTLPDITFAAVTDGTLQVTSGVRQGGVERRFPLTTTYRDQPLTVGSLTVEAGLEAVRSRLVERAWLVLLANGLMTALVAGLIYRLVGRIITDRLLALAAQSRRLGAGDLDTPVTLASTQVDEIVELAGAIDEMRRDLHQSQRRLLALNHELEASLIERTAALEQSRRAQQELAMAASVFANTQEGIVVTNGDGAILSVNKSFTRITGYTPEEALGQTPRIVKSDYQSADFYDAMWRALLETGRWQGELWNRRKNGEAFRAWQTITTIWDEHGRPQHRIAIFSDITELRRQEERLRYQAHFDALTGLANRVLLRERLEQAIAFAKRDQSRVAVMMLDLDRFKMVNDSLGHETGDRLLKQVAERLSTTIGATATVARLGGDEFAVLVWQVEDTTQLAAMAEAVIAAVREPYLLNDQEIHMGVSIGIAVHPQDGETAADVMRNADVALYRVKDSGRNDFRFFDPSMNSRALERLELEASLRRALQNNEFTLFYQPKVTVADGVYCGAEALIRWRHPVRGLVPPLEFIPIAEESGLINPIGAWALREACRQIAAWRAAGLPTPPVAVNVSAQQLTEGALPELISSALAEHGLPAECLEVELTESILMSDPDLGIRILAELETIGVGVAIDDFGTGYSSLNYLKRLPLRSLKIDRSFVKDIVTDPRDRAIVQAIVAMSHALGLSVVAEGVETEDQLRFLAAEGCDTAQGYMFAKPLPAADLPGWLAARHQFEPA